MTDTYAVIGNPIAHSKSPEIHAAFARATSHDIVYKRIFCELGQFAETVRAFQAEGGKGLNVTVPFKHEAFEFATRTSERAREAGVGSARQTRVERDNRLWTTMRWSGGSQP